MLRKIHVIDSHTGGEPTRVVLDGGPDLGDGDMAARRDRFRDEHDAFRRGVINEPRGWDAMVGAMLCPPVNPDSAAGVIFFNNVGYLGMCVHGLIGVVATLAHQNHLHPSRYRFETPVGDVWACLHEDGQVSVQNVASYRTLHNVKIAVEGYGDVMGDVAWGGNWFFLTSPWDNGCGASGAELPKLSLDSVDELTEFAWAIRQALVANKITGVRGEEIDHIELFGPPSTSAADSKNFVLCPGKEYDRSPCGTGTSAKVACLYSAGKLNLADTWKQESITGSIFEARITNKIHPEEPMTLYPEIKGSAYVTAETTLLFDPKDPFREGVSGGASA